MLKCSVKSIIPKNCPEVSYKQLTRNLAESDLVHHSLPSRKVLYDAWERVLLLLTRSISVKFILLNSLYIVHLWIFLYVF